jgi:undecaprenyl-diphosphatase
MQRHAFLLILVGAELFLIGLALAGFAHLNWWKVLELGILEGVTEFLPVSSTAHLLIATNLLDFEVARKGTFEIFIQLGAVIAVAGFYARDLLAQARALPVSGETRRFWLGILVAFLPAAILGLLLHSWIKAVLFSPPVIAAALIVGGIIFFVVERLPERTSTVHTLQDISLLQALGIGLAQTLAMIPGTSRSGASIIGGMLAGLDRQTATAFSFYLAIPTLGAATVYELLTSLSSLSGGDMGLLLLGMVVSLVVAWLSIAWLLRYVATNSFVPFGIYRIVAGILILVLIGWGKL